jgi:short-subunit dehydrogenase
LARYIQGESLNPKPETMSLLDQATVVITGASAGLGAEFARQLAPQVRCLILAARRVERLEALAAEVAREGLTVHCLPVNLADTADTDRFVARVRALDMKVNVLINNAGLGDHGLFEDSDWPRVEAMIDVNVTALTHVTHAFVKELIATGDAGILNVSSIASLLPLPQMAVYAATKAYVSSFTEALRAELRGTGVRVLALCPGPVDTEFSTVAERAGVLDTQKGAGVDESLRRAGRTRWPRGLEDDRARVIPGWFVFGVMMAAVAAPMFVKRFFLNRRGRATPGTSL